jgi:hypothetical protein
MRNGSWNRPEPEHPARLDIIAGFAEFAVAFFWLSRPGESELLTWFHGFTTRRVTATLFLGEVRLKRQALTGQT